MWQLHRFPGRARRVRLRYETGMAILEYHGTCDDKCDVHLLYQHDLRAANSDCGRVPVRVDDLGVRSSASSRGPRGSGHRGWARGACGAAIPYEIDDLADRRLFLACGSALAHPLTALSQAEL
jgi:hypothetical protein